MVTSDLFPGLLEGAMHMQYDTDTVSWNPGKVWQTERDMRSKSRQEWLATERQQQRDIANISGVSSSLSRGLLGSATSALQRQHSRQDQRRMLFMHPDMARQAEQALTAENLKRCHDKMTYATKPDLKIKVPDEIAKDHNRLQEIMKDVMVGWHSEKPKNTLTKLKADFKEWTADLFDFSYLKDVEVNPYEKETDYMTTDTEWYIPDNVPQPKFSWGWKHWLPTFGHHVTS